MSPDWFLRSRRVVTPGGTIDAAVAIAGEKIAAVLAPEHVPASSHVVDVGTSAVAPGLVDTHVHVNEPGRTDWEGFHTATRAAAAGGITTIVDMPPKSRPGTTAVRAPARQLHAGGRRVL